MHVIDRLGAAFGNDEITHNVMRTNKVHRR